MIRDRGGELVPATEMIDSTSMGDPAQHRSLDELVAAFAAMPPAPVDQGRLDLIVRRAAGGLREQLESAWLTPEEGVPGDAWGRKVPRLPEAQIAVMQSGVARLIANGQPVILSGDNLFVDLDLS